MKNGDGRILTHLAELKGIDMDWAPQLVLPSVELGDDLEARAEAIIAEAGKAREWVKSTLGQLDGLKGKKREVRELVAGQMASAQSKLADLLTRELPAYRRAAWVGLLEYEFSRKLDSKAEVEKLLGRLVEEVRLVESADGGLKAYGRTYTVSPASCFEEQEMAEVTEFLNALMSRVFQKTGEAREEKANRLRAASTITLEELVAGKPGQCAIEVPAEQVPANGNHHGFWRGGGTLLVESNGQNIWPIDAAGAIERTVLETVELKVFLLVGALKWEVPPTVKGIPREMDVKVQLLWHLVKRAIRAKMAADQIVQARKTLGERATITVREFFLEQKLGICLAEFQGTWQNPDRSAGPTDIFFLVERIEDEGTEWIHIADVPDHLRKFFISCMEEYEEKGNKFNGLPYPLVAVLQAIYSQAAKASQDAKKTGQIA